MIKAAQLSQQFHKLPAAIAMVVIASLYVVVVTALGLYIGDDAMSPGLLAELLKPMPMWVGVTANIIFNLGIMALMVLTNRAFNVLRALSWLHVGLFAVMQAAEPFSLLHFGSGSIVAAIIMVCTMLMFSTYSDPTQVRKVFLTFLLLSLGTAIQYGFIFYIPVFLLMCAQMRIMSPRAISAALLGIATVWIILLGFGIISINDIHMPQITDVFTAMESRSVLYTLGVIGITVLLLILSVTANVLKTIAYNAKARAFNGAMLVTALATLVALIIDFDNMAGYLPLLNVCAAYQITHYFVNHRYERQYIGVIGVIAIYIALYIWRFLLSL